MVYAIVIVTMLVFALVDMLIRLVRSRLHGSTAHTTEISQPAASALLDGVRRPAIHIVTASSGESAAQDAFNVPAGLFIARGHTWVALLADGQIRTGLDDLALKVLGPFDGYDLPEVGAVITRGEPLLRVFRGGRTMEVACPVSGRVSDVNSEIGESAHTASNGWICCLEPSDLSADLGALVLGAQASTFYEGEIERYLQICHGNTQRVTDDAETWTRVAEALLRQ